ncbi:glutathione S-transferase family protein [Thalassotalea euphylliae]|uniref:Glutathione S-transferase family protein n=1 Tax=Thalassotalea euphylliae TaxID=1655234 RepID=A0A3E0TSW7_9GAMM|nr:glutathione S-transferase family protein [Thalassotalea euphylliae]REL27025.1 glutathione S-transferase family protein [Thalassotalea euphylliae]
MKLFTFPPAPNPLRVSYFLKYKGLEIETEIIDLKEKQQFNDEYLAINPNATVPALLLDDNTLLTDSIAICTYLERKHPEKPLFGQNDEEYAHVIGWCHKLYVEGFSAVAEVLRNGSEFFADRALPGLTPIKQLPALVERGQTRIGVFWTMLDNHLSAREFVAASSFSQADIDAYAICQFASWVKASIPPECENLRRWYQQVAAILD